MTIIARKRIVSKKNLWKCLPLPRNKANVKIKAANKYMGLEVKKGNQRLLTIGKPGYN